MNFRFVDSLNLTLTHERRPWSYFWKIANENGGFIKSYDRVEFVSVRGAGHQVPTDKPVAAFRLFKYIINWIDNLDNSKDNHYNRQYY